MKLTESQKDVLALIAERKGYARKGSMAEWFEISPQCLSNILRQLQRRKLVEYSPAFKSWKIIPSNNNHEAQCDE